MPVGDPDRLHFDRQPLPGFGGHPVEIDVGPIVDDPTSNRHVRCHGLRRLERVVLGATRFTVGVVDHGERRDMKRADRRDFRRRADAKGMFARRTVGRDLESAGDLFLDVVAVSEAHPIFEVGQFLDVAGANARPVENDLAGPLQERSLDRHLDAGALLADPGRHGLDVHHGERRGRRCHDRPADREDDRPATPIAARAGQDEREHGGNGRHRRFRGTGVARDQPVRHHESTLTVNR